MLTIEIFLIGTLYGRCKREGIELSRSNPTPWSEDAMMEALDAVRYFETFQSDLEDFANLISIPF